MTNASAILRFSVPYEPYDPNTPYDSAKPNGPNNKYDPNLPPDPSNPWDPRNNPNWVDPKSKIKPVPPDSDIEILALGVLDVQLYRWLKTLDPEYMNSMQADYLKKFEGRIAARKQQLIDQFNSAMSSAYTYSGSGKGNPDKTKVSLEDYTAMQGQLTAAEGALADAKASGDQGRIDSTQAAVDSIKGSIDSMELYKMPVTVATVLNGEKTGQVQSGSSGGSGRLTSQVTASFHAITESTFPTDPNKPPPPFNPLDPHNPNDPRDPRNQPPTATYPYILTHRLVQHGSTNTMGEVKLRGSPGSGTGSGAKPQKSYKTADELLKALLPTGVGMTSSRVIQYWASFDILPGVPNDVVIRTVPFNASSVTYKVQNPPANMLQHFWEVYIEVTCDRAGTWYASWRLPLKAWPATSGINGGPDSQTIDCAKLFKEHPGQAYSRLSRWIRNKGSDGRWTGRFVISDGAVNSTNGEILYTNVKLHQGLLPGARVWFAQQEYIPGVSPGIPLSTR